MEAISTATGTGREAVEMSGLSPLEALRAIVAIIGLAISTLVFRRSHDGSMSFATPIRPIIIRQRRSEMRTYARIFGAALIQVTIASFIIDPIPLPWTAIIANAALIYIGCEMVGLTIRQWIWWSDLERIVGPEALIPEPSEAAVRASLDARDIMHEIHGHMTVAIGVLDLVLERTDISPDVRMQITIARDGLLDVRQLQFNVHTLIRSQSQKVRPIGVQDGYDDHDHSVAVRPENSGTIGVGDSHGEADNRLGENDHNAT